MLDRAEVGTQTGYKSVDRETKKKLLKTLEGHAILIHPLDFSPDSHRLLNGSDDGSSKMYDVFHSTLICTMSGHTSCALRAAFSPDNKHFPSGSSNRARKVQDVAIKQCLHTITDHKNQVWSVRHNNDGSLLISVKAPIVLFFRISRTQK